MTRFARAKGSKASNERIPEEATSWDEMKKQLLGKKKELEDEKKRKDAFSKRNANFKSFLEEKEKENDKNSTWAEFPGTSPPVSNVKEKNKNKRNKVSLKDSSLSIKKPEDSTITEIINESSSDAPPDERSSRTEITVPIITKTRKLKSKKPLKITLDQEKKVKETKDVDQQNVNLRKRKSSDKDQSIKKKLKKEKNTDSQQKQESNNKEKKKIVKENLTEKDLKKIEKKKQKLIKQLEKKKRIKAELKKQREEEMMKKENGETESNEKQTETPSNTFGKSLNTTAYPKKPNNGATVTNKKKKAEKGNEEHSRKKPLLPHKMFINGKELEIEYVDGFPVKKEDAVRLKKLRREMISKGLPRSEINMALKLERRKAEKAFAREKKKVCFHCRKSGHNLSECPDIDNNEVAQTTASGICFKCGSTEHTHFECKVVRGQEFKYATCFICKEQGHIARQCPDNARGLYPKGGACKVCGDVTHLKKDCPKYQAQQQKQEENMRIETFGNSNPDNILEEKDNVGGFTNSKRPNKIIKF